MLRIIFWLADELLGFRKVLHWFSQLMKQCAPEQWSGQWRGVRTEVAKLFSELLFATKMLKKRKEYVLLHFILIYLILDVQKTSPLI
jgi:hypothetical protein